ncbi:MAG: hypothetical protein AAGA85_05730 [Bacteroidota bacterium]
MNKHKTYRPFMIWVIALGLVGCFDPPEFAEVPSIQYENIVFALGPIRNPDRPELGRETDTLNLTFEFEDGDGDIGLNSNEDGPPYHSFNIVIDNRDSVVTISDDAVEPPFFAVDPFGNRTLISDTDIRPDFVCEGLDWLVVGLDTIFIQANEFNKNIFVSFFRKIGGEYININAQLSPDPCQQSFDARIPIFDEANIGRSLSGSITYSMISTGFEPLFRLDTMRLEFFIYDRQLNKSNTVSTPDFVLPDITR